MVRKSCLNFCMYDLFYQSDTILKFLNSSEELGISLNLEPTSMGYGTRKKLFSYNKKKLHSAVLKEEPLSLSLFFETSEKGTSSDWQSYSSINKYAAAYLINYCLVETTELNFIRDLISHFSNALEFKYAFCDIFSFDEKPEYYNYGIIGRDHNKDSRVKISKWGNNYFNSDGKYRLGDFRDVYRYNILTEPHLKRVVGTTMLKEWIESNPVNGSLEKITEEHWLWSVNPDEIPRIQETLAKENLLVAYWDD